MHKPRRCSVCAALAVYLIGAAPAWPAALDTALVRMAAQRTKVVIGDFPCAHHGCGCRTAEQCRRQCCCEERRAAAQRPAPAAQCHLPAQRTAAITVLAAAECGGHSPNDSLFSGRGVGPHLPTASPPSQMVPVRLPAPDYRDSRAIAFRDPPDQVPKPKTSHIRRVA